MNGAFDADATARADAGQGGVLAKLFVRMFRGFVSGEWLNPLLAAHATGMCGRAVRRPAG